MMNFQRDGHMQFQVPAGRVSYSPSSLEPNTPREDPQLGFVSTKERVEGDNLRIRPELFADHFSQARQFFLSQTETEQNHIVSAFIFELSKVETVAIRERMLGQLANVDMGVARRVADGLGMPGKISKVATTVPAREDLPESPALSILKKATKSLEGRLIGCLVADGSDTSVVANLIKVPPNKIASQGDRSKDWRSQGQRRNGDSCRFPIGWGTVRTFRLRLPGTFRRGCEDLSD
jgi:catalase